jgi:hypothetical protein
MHKFLHKFKQNPADAVSLIHFKGMWKRDLDHSALQIPLYVINEIYRSRSNTFLADRNLMWRSYSGSGGLSVSGCVEETAKDMRRLSIFCVWELVISAA